MLETWGAGGMPHWSEGHSSLVECLWSFESTSIGGSGAFFVVRMCIFLAWRMGLGLEGTSPWEVTENNEKMEKEKVRSNTDSRLHLDIQRAQLCAQYKKEKKLLKYKITLILSHWISFRKSQAWKNIKCKYSKDKRVWKNKVMQILFSDARFC